MAKRHKISPKDIPPNTLRIMSEIEQSARLFDGFAHAPNAFGTKTRKDMQRFSSRLETMAHTSRGAPEQR